LESGEVSFGVLGGGWGIIAQALPYAGLLGIFGWCDR
jgi:hypothetical protein